MGFYQMISKHYDYIFPFNKATYEFISKAFGDRKNILDIACATGIYTSKLNDNGYHAIGIDLDEDMIKIAKTKDPKTEFYLQNMLDLRDLEKYDGVFCIGNSIVHLENQSEIEKSIKLMFNSLKEDGILILQIINYDRIISQNIRGLSTIKNDLLEFERNYDYKDGYIYFSGILKIDHQQFVNITKLFPLKHDELILALEKVGFTDIKCFDGFSDQAFDKDKSIQLVVKANKKGEKNE